MTNKQMEIEIVQLCKEITELHSRLASLEQRVQHIPQPFLPVQEIPRTVPGPFGPMMNREFRPPGSDFHGGLQS